MDQVGLDEITEYANAYAIASHPIHAYYFSTTTTYSIVDYEILLKSNK